MKKILISGSSTYGISKGCSEVLSEKYCIIHASRSTGYNLVVESDKDRFIELSMDCEIVINNSSLRDFHQIRLFDKLYRAWRERGKIGHIINIGSQADRSRWPFRKYSVEKTALQAISDQAQLECYDKHSGIKVTYIAFSYTDTGVPSLNPAANVKNLKKHSITEIGELVKFCIEYPHTNSLLAEIRVNVIQ